MLITNFQDAVCKCVCMSIAWVLYKTVSGRLFINFYSLFELSERCKELVVFVPSYAFNP